MHVQNDCSAMGKYLQMSGKLVAVAIFLFPFICVKIPISTVGVNQSLDILTAAKECE
jgi:hypothetical protein